MPGHHAKPENIFLLKETYWLSLYSRRLIGGSRSLWVASRLDPSTGFGVLSRVGSCATYLPALSHLFRMRWIR